MNLRILYRKAGILTGFIPLIVYGILAGSSVKSVIIALGSATIIGIIFGLSDLRKGRILTWTNLGLFASLLIVVSCLSGSEILPFMGILIYATLAVVTFGSILAGIPFTTQYAREMVNPSLWENPAFIRVNILMTGAWGCIFAINFFLSCLMLMTPEFMGRIAQSLTYIVLVAGIVFTIWYPGHVQKKRESVPVQGRN